MTDLITLILQLTTHITKTVCFPNDELPVILQAKITMYNQEKNGPVAEPTPIPDTDLNSGSLTIAVKHRQTSTVQLKTPKPNQPKKTSIPWV